MAIKARHTLGAIQLLEVDASPNGSISAPLGSFAINSVASEIYRNTDGATTWTAIGVSATSPIELSSTGVISILASALGLKRAADSIYVTSSAQQVLTFSSLDGDTDRMYLCVQRVITGASTTSYTYEPNGVSTNINTVWHNVTSGAGHSVGTASDMLYGGGVAASAESFVVTFISAQKSKMRWFNTFVLRITGGTTAITQYGGRWNETSTNLTSLELQSTQSDGFAVGSEVHLFKFGVS